MRILLSMMLLMGAVPARSQTPIVIDGATLIDGTGGPPLQNSVVITRSVRQITKQGVLFDHDALVEESKR